MGVEVFLYKSKLFVVAGMAAMLTACQGGQATPPPPPSQVQSQSSDREVTDFQRGLALGHFQASCGEGTGPDGVRCFAYLLTPSGRAEAKAREALSGSRSISSTSPGGYGPAQLQAAYGTAPASGGSGRLVAIVDKGNDPNLEADLGTYRAQFGLPACTTANGCFRKVNQTGGTSYPATDASWAQETSLDVDMVSANCPNCHILVVETNSTSFTDLAAGVNTAASLGAVAISNSYGGSESSSETSIASAYNHAGIAITASNGDSGYGTESPAAFNTLTAVGGTSLSTASNSRGWTETVWSGSGSGCSAYISKPSWQHDPSCARRMIGDVGYVADPYTGVAVYDSLAYQGYSGWLVFGGTSVGAPSIAAIYALAGNTVSNASNVYSHTSSLHDVTTGSNGRCSVAYFCNGEVGYDGPTGFGTPAGTAAF
jgi:subtilase family serine protease